MYSHSLQSNVHIDENILASSLGIYAFLAQCAFYHNIKGLYPNESVQPCFLYLYIYDTNNELHNIMQENPRLLQTIVQKLPQILHQYNYFIISYSSKITTNTPSI